MTQENYILTYCIRNKISRKKYDLNFTTVSDTKNPSPYSLGWKTIRHDQIDIFQDSGELTANDAISPELKKELSSPFEHVKVLNAKEIALNIKQTTGMGNNRAIMYENQINRFAQYTVQEAIQGLINHARLKGELGSTYDEMKKLFENYKI